jgi:hypothetical protein
VDAEAERRSQWEQQAANRPLPSTLRCTTKWPSTRLLATSNCRISTARSRGRCAGAVCLFLLALQLLLTFWRVGNRPKSQISRTSQARTSLASFLAMCGHQCLDIKKKGSVDESKGVCSGFRCWKLSAFCIRELSTLTQTPLLLPMWLPHMHSCWLRTPLPMFLPHLPLLSLASLWQFCNQRRHASTNLPGDA